MVTAEQVKKIIGKNKFSYHECGICGYICGFVIINGQLYYDSGCSCITGHPSTLTPNTDEQLMEFFKMNPQIKDVKKYVKEHLYNR